MTREARDQALFDRIAERYARKDVLPASAIARRHQLLEALRPLLEESGSLGRIVDVGCGVGGAARYLAGRYDHYTGVDQSGELIRVARTLHRGRPDVEFIESNIKSAGIPPASADLVLSEGALHHMSDLDEVMGTLIRFARPGGWLVAREPQSGNPLIQAMRRIRGRWDADYSTEQVFFSERDLGDLCDRHGLARRSIDFQGFFVPPFAQVVFRPQSLAAPLSRLAGWTDRRLHRLLPYSVRKLGFNVVLIARFPDASAGEVSSPDR